MYGNIDLPDGSCCGPSMLSLRILTFADGSQVGIAGLDTVMEIMYQKGKSADSATVTEIMERLKHENDFDSSCQQTYEELFLLAYQRFLEMKLESVQRGMNTISNQKTSQNENTRGVLDLFRGEKAPNEGSCCNIKIIPKQQPAKKSNKGGCCNIRVLPKEDAVRHKES